MWRTVWLISTNLKWEVLQKKLIVICPIWRIFTHFCCFKQHGVYWSSCLLCWWKCTCVVPACRLPQQGSWSSSLLHSCSTLKIDVEGLWGWNVLLSHLDMILVFLPGVPSVSICSRNLIKIHFCCLAHTGGWSLCHSNIKIMQQEMRNSALPQEWLLPDRELPT